MTRRLLEGVGAAAVILVVSGLLELTPTVSGQASPQPQAPAAAKTGSAPRTPWGDPDLQGTWDNTFRDWGSTFERADKYGGRAELTDQEFAALERRDVGQSGGREPVRPGDTGFYSTRVWGDDGRQTRQTSQVVDPPNGKLPPLTPEGAAARTARRKGGASRDEPTGSWEDLHLWERCISKGGMPNIMFPRGYNNNTQIVQTPGYVALLHEMIHEVRIIPLDGRPHLPQDVRQWDGDPRGHWEGDTLVVDTTNIVETVSALQPWSNFTSRTGNGSGQQMHLVERLTRLGPDTIDYRVTVEDPLMYTKPWTVSLPMSRSTEQVFEYACHEANYTMTSVLAGARLQEQAEAEAAKSGKPVTRRPAGPVGPPE